jgi:hypothetical protein
MGQPIGEEEHIEVNGRNKCTISVISANTSSYHPFHHQVLALFRDKQSRKRVQINESKSLRGPPGKASSYLRDHRFFFLIHFLREASFTRVTSRRYFWNSDIADVEER